MLGDAHHLPFPDGTFDRSHTMETFVTPTDTHQVLRELMRVTRPGGRVLGRETDSDAGGMLGSDLALMRRFSRFFGNHVNNGAIGRRVIGWCRELGWSADVVAAVGVSEERGAGQAWLIEEWLVDA